MNKDYRNELHAFARNQFEIYNIKPSFPDWISNLKEADFIGTEHIKREDFCSENIFSIDSDDCKDMDDAIGIQKTETGYCLGIHIADVSEYIPFGSGLDSVAINRATSIYLPDLTITMLPQILSNYLCSLNPGAIRPTMSVIINLDSAGNVLNYKITKGKICSKVKGVYSEINAILLNAIDERLRVKYFKVLDDIQYMNELYLKLRQQRILKGARVEDSNKPKIYVHENMIEIVPHHDGDAENIIEEFMILANKLVSEYLYERNLPVVFRVQRESNELASYELEKSVHSDLKLESYTHFTSPIRRISDLKIHQILSMHLMGLSKDKIHELLDDHLGEVCEIATKKRSYSKGSGENL